MTLLPAPFADSYHNGIKILFIGLTQSTHTHAWEKLIADQGFNIQHFSMPGELPSNYSNVKTYHTNPSLNKCSDTTKFIYSGFRGRTCKYFIDHPRRDLFKIGKTPNIWLKEIITNWKPDIIHTLGLFDGQGGMFYYQCRKKYHLEKHGKWILTLRGGSDIALRKLDPVIAPGMIDILMECDQIISDNVVNMDYLNTMGIPRKKIASITPVPGTGGIDVDHYTALWSKQPSQRERIIIWPKAYECQWSKAVPVFEALKLCWEKLQPCEIYLLAANAETKMWFWDLPLHIRQHCHLFDRIEQAKLIELLVKSRVMLAPSLVDGIPNSLYEAMACGTFPIVSPLETIKTVVQNEKNGLFARNLYPQEIADALIRAMTDDSLIDRCTRENVDLVRQKADRKKISPLVNQYYTSLLVR